MIALMLRRETSCEALKGHSGEGTPRASARWWTRLHHHRLGYKCSSSRWGINHCQGNPAQGMVSAQLRGNNDFLMAEERVPASP